MHEFDGDTRKYEALLDFAPYKDLHEFVLNDAATAAHASSLKLIGIGHFDANKLDQLREATTATLRHALAHFACQTIVSLCTTFEVSARDLFKAIFAKKPGAMFQYLGPEDAPGHVALKEIVQASSHDVLISKLALRASGTAAKGKYGQMYTRAMSLCGGSGDKELADRLNALQGQRNRYVHERHRPTVGLEEVLEAHATVDAAIESLCELGIAGNVPGRYTCVRPEARMIVQDIDFLVRKDAQQIVATDT